MSRLQVFNESRAVHSPDTGLNVSMDFNAAPGGGARGTEVIIPDNASPQVRAAAHDYNNRVAAFAAKHGYSNYRVRGVRTRSENGRGVRNTIHTEPFFNDDLRMQRIVQENPAEFAAIYQESFGDLDARLIPPHGVGRDRGASSPVFGDETSFGELMADNLISGRSDGGSGIKLPDSVDPASSGYTDFPDGLESPEDYTRPRPRENPSDDGSDNNVNDGELDGGVNDPAAGEEDLESSVAILDDFIIPTGIESTLKELICSLVNGNGLKLPNIQVCINFAIDSLFNEIEGKVSQLLQQALGALQSAFKNFMNHLNLDNVLGRINGAIAQITNIANMINFCSSPVDPIQIPNVLENLMSSFLGKGMEILNKIGEMSLPNIGGCLGGTGFNPNLFDSGILRTVGDNLPLLVSTLDTPIENDIINQINEVVRDIEDLIELEENVPTTYSNGGSNFNENRNRPVWDGVAALYNAQDEGLSGATRHASSLWSAYRQLGSYQVIDSQGNVYNNIFELFVDEDLLRLLRRRSNPQPKISRRQPIFNYCGDIVGFEEIVTQDEPTDVSRGNPPNTLIDDPPGYNAGGLSTNSFAAAENEITEATQEALDSGDVVIPGSTNSNIISGEAQTTDNVPVPVIFDEEVSLIPDEGNVWFFTVLAVANRTNSNDMTAIKLEGLINRFNDTVTLATSSDNKTVFNSLPNYDLTVDVIDNNVQISVQGDTGHNVNWNIRYDYVEA